MARRRMGLAAVAASSGPPPADFGALFGLGGGRQEQAWEKGVRWQAPNTQVPSIGAPPPPPGAAGEQDQRQYGHIMWPWAGPPSKKRKLEDDIVPAQGKTPAQSVRESRQAFGALLEEVNASAQERIQLVHMKQLSSFLLSSADESEASNLVTLVHWLAHWTVDDGALRELAYCVLDKARLGTLSASQLIPALSFLIHRTSTRSQPSITEYLKQIVSVVARSPETLRRVVRKVTFYLPQTTPAEKQAVQHWISILDSCLQLCQGPPQWENEIWKAVYMDKARHLKPSELAGHFARLDPESMAQVLLRFWVPHCVRDEEVSATFEFKRGSRVIDLRRPKLDATAIEQIVIDFETMREADRRRRQDAIEAALARGVSRESKDWADIIAWKNHDVPLKDLLLVLERHGIPTRNLTNEILSIYKSQPDLQESYWIFFGALLFNQARTPLALPKDATVEMIHHILARLQELPIPTKDSAENWHNIRKANRPFLRRAWKIFKNDPTISLLSVFELPLKLIEHGYGTPERIFWLLNRKTAEDIVPPSARPVEERGVKAAKCSLKREAVDLVHLVAYHWANQEGEWSARACFRRVWECFRFLQDRGAPFSVLMSRSLVKAGILRYLEEQRHLPMAQVRYILHLVRRLEGEDVAQNLDRLVDEARRSNRVLRDGRSLWAGNLDSVIARSVEWRLRRKVWAVQGKQFPKDYSVRRKRTKQMKAQGWEGRGRRLPRESPGQQARRQEVDAAMTRPVSVEELAAEDDAFEHSTEGHICAQGVDMQDSEPSSCASSAPATDKPAVQFIPLSPFAKSV